MWPPDPAIPDGSALQCVSSHPSVLFYRSSAKSALPGFNNVHVCVYHRGMKNIMIALLLMISATVFAPGQTPKPADPKDVSSMDSIMKAIYDVISGEKGKPRDWDRFRS